MKNRIKILGLKIFIFIFIFYTFFVILFLTIRYNLMTDKGWFQYSKYCDIFIKNPLKMVFDKLEKLRNEKCN